MTNPDRCPGCRSTSVVFVSYEHSWVWFHPNMNAEGDDIAPRISFCPLCGVELPSDEEMEGTCQKDKNS